MEVFMEDKITSPLAETTTLIRLTTKFWSGIKADKRLRVALAEDVNATDNRSLHVAKHLVGNNANKYFRRIINGVRNDLYYPMTLAWDDNSYDDDGKVQSGWRLCPNSRIDVLMEHLSIAKDNFFKEVDGFCKRYPLLIEEARHQLGDAFNIEDYPDVEEIREKFKFDFEVNLLSSWNNYSTDIRTTASSSVVDRIVNDAKKREQKNVKSILRDFIGGVVEQGEHIVEKLATYDPKQKQKGGFFKNSSIDKFRQCVEMIPSVNSDILGNDKEIATAHQELVQVLAQINDIDSLRDESEIGESKRQNISTGIKDAIDPLKSSLFDKLKGGDNEST